VVCRLTPSAAANVRRRTFRCELADHFAALVFRRVEISSLTPRSSTCARTSSSCARADGLHAGPSDPEIAVRRESARVRLSTPTSDPNAAEMNIDPAGQVGHRLASG